MCADGYPCPDDERQGPSSYDVGRADARVGWTSTGAARMRRRALLALFTLGCHDGGSEPKDVSVPAVGRYAYSFAPIGRGELIHPQTGDLYITYASRDSLAGVWDVAEYLRPVVGGAWDGDAYVIEALSAFDSYAGTAFHRLTTAGARDLLRCEGRDS